jgi:hypothetical protein
MVAKIATGEIEDPQPEIFSDPPGVVTATAPRPATAHDSYLGHTVVRRVERCEAGSRLGALYERLAGMTVNCGFGLLATGLGTSEFSFHRRSIQMVRGEFANAATATSTTCRDVQFSARIGG